MTSIIGESTLRLVDNTAEAIFPPALDQAVEAAWEGAHLYPRYDVDTTILGGRSLIEYPTHWRTIDQRQQRDYTIALLQARYLELTGVTKPSVGCSPDDKSDDMLMLDAVDDAWTKHYFEPRTEAVGIGVYNDWVEARAAFTPAGLTNVTLHDYEPNSSEKFVRALAPLTMIPRYGSASLQIIAPPNTPVDGELGHSEVYRWDDMGRSNESTPIQAFASTQQRLLARDLIKRVDLNSSELRQRDLNHN